MTISERLARLEEQRKALEEEIAKEREAALEPAKKAVEDALSDYAKLAEVSESAAVRELFGPYLKTRARSGEGLVGSGVAPYRGPDGEDYWGRRGTESMTIEFKDALRKARDEDLGQFMNPDHPGINSTTWRHTRVVALKKWRSELK